MEDVYEEVVGYIFGCNSRFNVYAEVVGYIFTFRPASSCR
jgi:hypothetical protein